MIKLKVGRRKYEKNIEKLFTTERKGIFFKKYSLFSEGKLCLN
jgi:hypothetical protein